MLSRQFIERIKLAQKPSYQIAIAAGLHPATLSKLIHGAERIKPDDPRVLAVAQQIGLTPEECFE